MTRFTLSCLSLAFVAVASAAPVPKAGTPELKWKFAKGDSFYVKYEQETTSGINGGAGVGVQSAVGKSVMVYKFTVVSVGEKETVAEVQFESSKSGNGAGGGALQMNEDKAIAGKKVTLTLDAAHQVTKVDGGAELAKAAPAAAAGMMSEEFLKYLMADLLGSVPGKALSKGEKWTAEAETPLAQGLTAKRTNRGVVDEVKDGVAKLSVEADHSWVGGAGGGGPAVNYNLKGEKGQTTVWFDTKSGKLTKREESYSLSGSIDLGGGGGGAQPQAITINVKMKNVVTVSDKPPTDE